jgi:hypothetical protein
MVLILASTNLLTARIAAGCFIASLLVMLLVAKNVSGYVHRFVANITFVNALVVLGITNSYERVHIVFPFNN